MGHSIVSLFPHHALAKIVRRKKDVLRICAVCKSVYAKKGNNQACSLDCSLVLTFWRYVTKTETCWLWTGTTAKGYGYITRPRQKIWFYAHRFSYALHVGPIPDGYEIDHLCRQPLCVRPDHLEVVTHTENLRRGTSFSSVNRAKTHCIAGHPFDEGNTWYDKHGKRQCRACSRRRSAERSVRLKNQS